MKQIHRKKVKEIAQFREKKAKKVVEAKINKNILHTKIV